MRLRPDAGTIWRGADNVAHAVLDRYMRSIPLPYPGDQIIDTAMARALHADACRSHAIVAWIVLWDLPAYSGRYAARLATGSPVPSPYLLLADSPPVSTKLPPR
jgi:hypothetical protein